MRVWHLAAALAVGCNGAEPARPGGNSPQDPGDGAPPAPLAVSTPSLPPATVGVWYKITLEASGGTPPYRWEMRSQVPPGLSVSPAGHVTGIPNRQGEYRFSVRVHDIEDRIAAADLLLAVEGESTGRN